MATSSLTDAEIRRIIGQPTNAYDTHRPVLAEAIIRTSGMILELGMGYGSTPALEEIAHSTGRIVVSYEDDPAWFNKMAPRLPDIPARVDGGPHFYGLVQDRDWDKCHIDEPRWSVALVDHGQMQRRVREIGRLAQNTEIVVVHDTEDWRYNYWSAYALFTYRYDYKKHKPWTTAFSNSIDVSQWNVA